MSDPKPQADKVPKEGDKVPGEGVAVDAPQGRTTEDLLAEAQGKLEEQREAWLRALADAENARKRAQADIVQARKYAAERMVEDLLPVMDSLEAALGAGGQETEALRAGVELTRKQLLNAFERAGVAEVNPAPGQRFDPHRHQAMAAAESDQEPNTVLALMQKGYTLHERIVRPALVTVAKAKAVENGAGNPISDSNLESN
ncbi:MAG: nucleotide exchange factor GrpE [Betaproteobacteria bacterium]|nr:nucleotide exchange factor GrpE [Betaproteobacteria bacterium]MDH4326430.1 nucleotide exchange factor GrpE [Betaproteobacteria bacterium]MDH5210656.1 nucleotide exchange factor GrpE [Betaproteobacteria bacterium]